MVDPLSLAAAGRPDRALAQGQPGYQGRAGRVGVARENVLAQKGAYYPSVAASFSASRQKTSSELAPIPNSNAVYFNLYTPQVSVSYVPDVFALNRRTVESLQAQAEQARFALAATHITLSANVAAAAIQEASCGRRLPRRTDSSRSTPTCSKSCASSSRRVCRPARRGGAGIATRADRRHAAAAAQATGPAARPAGRALRRFPEPPPAKEFELSGLQLPQELPLSLPARLVEQRPDVRQAEENLHAASAEIGSPSRTACPTSR